MTDPFYTDILLREEMKTTVTFTYIDGDKKITNTYSGNASSAIYDTMKKFVPSSQRIESTRKCVDRTAYAVVDRMSNPFSISEDVRKTCFQSTR